MIRPNERGVLVRNRLSCVSKLVAALVVICGLCAAQAPAKYEPTLESLDKHPLPEWYAGAKLDIFIHWSLYSVPR